MTLPTPHGDKLQALPQNNKLPNGDRKRIEGAIRRYRAWLKGLAQAPADNRCVDVAVSLLNEYRTFVDLEVVFDSEDDFLYRQKGQLKLDNTVIEEFLPHLFARVFPQLSEGFSVGPHSCFAALYFTSTIGTATNNPGTQARTKDQDFTISKRLYLRASFDPEHATAVDRIEANLGYLCAECKTNLDKTMFQEACATAHDVKTAVPGAKYLLLYYTGYPSPTLTLEVIRLPYPTPKSCLYDSSVIGPSSGPSPGSKGFGRFGPATLARPRTT